MALTVIEKIERRIKRIARGNDPKVKPGQTERLNEACVTGDFIRQGDLYIIVFGVVPAGYVHIVAPTERDKQLVPGNTQGAKHCLDSLSGVELWLPKEWTEDTLEGPFLRLSKERTILHPTHGACVIAAGVSVRLAYQREWSREEAKERRARD